MLWKSWRRRLEEERLKIETAKTQIALAQLEIAKRQLALSEAAAQMAQKAQDGAKDVVASLTPILVAIASGDKAAMRAVIEGGPAAQRPALVRETPTAGANSPGRIRTEA